MLCSNYQVFSLLANDVILNQANYKKIQFPEPTMRSPVTKYCRYEQSTYGDIRVKTVSKEASNLLS